MKRPAGVVASAVVLALVSLFQIVMALGMALAAAIDQDKGLVAAQSAAATPAAPLPSWMPVLMYGMGVFFLLLAAWGIATTIGVYRLRHWARYSILIIGGCMAVFFSIYTLLMLVLMAVPVSIPATPAAPDPHATEAIYKITMGILAFLCALGAAIGVWWLVYFNRKSVRAVFAGPAGELAESRRPLLVSVYAVFCLIAFACLLVTTFAPVPATLFGYLFEGWQKAAFYLLFAAINLAIGIGLWRMAEWARRLAFAYLALGAVHLIVYLVRPSLWLRNMAVVHRAMHLPPQPEFAPQVQHFQHVFYIAVFSLSLLLMAAIAYMLHYYRARFAPPSEIPLQPPLAP